MASSVSSEQAFSAAGLTITKQRNRLKGDIVEALQVLKCKIKSDNIMRSAAAPNLAFEEELDACAEQEDVEMAEAKKELGGEKYYEDILLSDDECYDLEE